MVGQEQGDAAVAHIEEQTGGLHVLMNIVGSNALNNERSHHVPVKLPVLGHQNA